MKPRLFTRNRGYLLGSGKLAGVSDLMGTGPTQKLNVDEYFQTFTGETLKASIRVILKALKPVVGGRSSSGDGCSCWCLGHGPGSEGRQTHVITQTPDFMKFGLKMEGKEKVLGRKAYLSYNNYDVIEKYQESNLVEFLTQDQFENILSFHKVGVVKEADFHYQILCKPLGFLLDLTHFSINYF